LGDVLTSSTLPRLQDRGLGGRVHLVCAAPVARGRQSYPESASPGLRSQRAW
jgi:hypothetical protein